MAAIVGCHSSILLPRAGVARGKAYELIQVLQQLTCDTAHTLWRRGLLAITPFLRQASHISYSGFTGLRNRCRPEATSGARKQKSGAALRLSVNRAQRQFMNRGTTLKEPGQKSKFLSIGLI
jgi:hypothetical protein